MSNEERFANLSVWLEERRLSFQSLADAMGCSRAFVSAMMRRETMPDRRWRQCLLLGLPEDFIPRPFEGSLGRPRKRVQLHSEAQLNAG